MNPPPRDAWQTIRPPADESAASATSTRRQGAFSAHTLPGDNHHVTRGEFDERMGQVLDRLDDLKDAVSHHLPELMRQAMAQAMQDVIERPETSKTVLANMREAATQQAIEATGRGVWSVLKTLFTKWLLIAVVLVTLAGVAGWQPAVTAARAVFGAARP